MSKLDRNRLDEICRRYPDDPCRQIATYVLEDSGTPEDDRVCATSILGALDAADHDDYLTAIPVDGMILTTAAFEEAKRLWQKYGEEEGRVRPG